MHVNQQEVMAGRQAGKWVGGQGDREVGGWSTPCSLVLTNWLFSHSV